MYRQWLISLKTRRCHCTPSFYINIILAIVSKNYKKEGGYVFSQSIICFEFDPFDTLLFIIFHILFKQMVLVNLNQHPPCYNQAIVRLHQCTILYIFLNHLKYIQQIFDTPNFFFLRSATVYRTSIKQS